MFPEIDKEQTKKIVHRLLSNYSTMARLADEEYTPEITATFSLELKGWGGKPSDQVGNAVARKVTAEQELWKIGRAMNQLNAYKSQNLHYRYIDSREMMDTMIYYDLNMSERRFYRELGKAQTEFAESYDNGRLLAEI
ncbi:ArpU family phage packaging/lysis transcriptional regulator [Alkalibacterium putridalgicola]|uniref:ArpU family phage packaging/lysis transcriptional regulator n=1 Tax=Alkalibacterium putridalgicola TaxID=426703 RepID=UPI0034CD4C2E